MSEKLSGLDKRRDTAYIRYMEKSGRQLGEMAARLDSLSPLKVLSRGYSLVYSEDKLINSSEQLDKGDRISIRFGIGGAEAEIKDKW